MQTVLDLITETLIGRDCTHDGENYVIVSLTINRGEFSVAIENEQDLIRVPMSAVQIETAMRNVR